VVTLIVLLLDVVDDSSLLLNLLCFRRKSMFEIDMGPSGMFVTHQ